MTPEGPIYSIYLSGKITGDPDYENKFKKAAHVLRTAYPAAKVFNPAWEFLGISKKLEKSGISEDAAHEILVDMCTKIMEEYEAIALLPDWGDSCGAIAEFQTALRKEMKVIRVPEEWVS